jgi:hypothetical protein
MYVMDGSIKTMKSTWNGPPGQIVRALGKCFHPETKIRLKNGSVVKMMDVNAGDVLEDNSSVIATMKIDNSKSKIPYYKIKGRGVCKEDIYVTGSHLVYDSNSDKFIPVEKYKHAVLSDTDNKTEWFSCLITHDHNITIGDEVFWDWEDYYIKH